MEAVYIPVKYDQNKASIMFSHPVSVDSIFALCSSIDLAIEYYQYSTVELVIDSPGGSVAALKYYLDKLDYWKSKGVTIQTNALTFVASASAVILSSGTLGFRSAPWYSSLVYHNSRCPTEALINSLKGAGQYVTSDFLSKFSKEVEHLGKGLTQEDKALVGFLDRHITSNPDWEAKFENRVSILGRITTRKSPDPADPGYLFENDFEFIVHLNNLIEDSKSKGASVYDQWMSALSFILLEDARIHPIVAYSLMLIDKVPVLSAGNSIDHIQNLKDI